MSLTESNATDTTETDFSKTDFTDPKNFDHPWPMYKWLRAQETLHYDEKNDLYIAPRHEDVFTMSRNSDRYCSKFGVRPVIAGDMSIITLDGEEHTQTRRLINKGFTPRRTKALMPRVKELTNQLADELREREGIDFVEDFAIHIPLIIICEMMGLDPEQRLKMYKWSDAMMDGDGHIEADDPVLLKAAEAFGGYAEMCLQLIAERREDPQDDLISVLTQAFDAGDLEREFKAYQGITQEEAEERAKEGLLNDDELFAFLAVLLVAGNETTRNAISGGALALSLFPEQRQLMVDNIDDEEFMDRAVEEIIRYVTPVLGFIRTVTEDHTYRGTDLKEGDRVLMLYGSANQDETVIPNPEVLDLTREANPHLAFGIGPHFCLGANLARLEVKVVFQELYRRFPNLTIDEDAVLDRGDSTLVLALQHLPATMGQECPVNHGA